MTIYAWNSKKNELLLQERGISFEDIVLNIHLGNEMDIYDHPNQERYPGQKISVVLVEGYAYLVPFVENKDEIFLKTIIPSRKATKHHLGESNE
ncbi:MAG: BrnT family toxin [Candidatus Thiodiazotropha sp. (ex Rostrolucina anterorostrata)]|nr:BrnT family toxin [Candidatus Thiodiazotropha sp. (ex Rostrolucina anterorostrata)]